MSKLRWFLLFVILSTSIVNCSAQSFSPSKGQPGTKTETKPPPTGHLVPVGTVVAPTEVASSFDLPIKCDTDGNLYLQSEHFGASGIRKLNDKGERIALFQPNANPEMKIIGVGDYAVSPSGELYEIVLPEEITRYVMVYKSDGTYKSLIKLQPGFAWIPSTLAVFSSGDLLVSGLKYDKNEKRFMWPFTWHLLFRRDFVEGSEVRRRRYVARPGVFRRRTRQLRYKPVGQFRDRVRSVASCIRRQCLSDAVGYSHHLLCTIAGWRSSPSLRSKPGRRWLQASRNAYRR